MCMESWLLFLLEFLRAEALKQPPNMFQNYLPSQDGMTHNQFIKMMIIFSIAFVTVLILKVSSPCPTTQGGVMRLCCSRAPHARLLGDREVCLPCLPSLLWAPNSSAPHTSSFDPTWDPQGPPS